MPASQGINADFQEFGNTSARVASSGKRACQRLAFRPLEPAVRKRRLDDPADAANARVDRRAPGRREDVDDRIFVGIAQQRDERLRQDRVADPRRGNDQDTFAHRDFGRHYDTRQGAGGDVPRGGRGSRTGIQCPPTPIGPGKAVRVPQ
jgi:hypothetical protein